MKKLIILLLFVLTSMTINAEPLLEKFKQEVQHYLDAQNKSPSTLIKYSDEQGALAKAVLSPHRARMMFEEVFAESEDKNQSQFNKFFSASYEPVLVNYIAAFQQPNRNYEAEYLDSTEVLFQLTASKVNFLKLMRVLDSKNETERTKLEADIESASGAPRLLIEVLENDIKEARFNASFVRIVEARIAKLRTQIGR